MIQSTVTPGATQIATDADVEHYVQQGYLVKEGLIGPEEIEELKADVLKLARGGYPCKSLEPISAEIDDATAMEQILCIHQPHNISPVIKRFTEHPLISAVLGRVVAAHLAPGLWDGSVKCMQSMYFLKSPGKPGQAWHQDEIYIPTRDRSLAGAWIAVDDATIDNGCLWVLPGSHRPGVLFDQRDHNNPEHDFAQESYGFDDRAEVPVEVPAGSVVFFNGYLLHRSKKNRSNRYRRALVNHYMSGQSLLPWVGTDTERKTPVARMDVRKVHMVAGEDPYTWKEYQPGQQDVWLRSYEGFQSENRLKNE